MNSKFNKLFNTIMESTKPSKKITSKKVIKEAREDWEEKFERQVEQWNKKCDENRVMLDKLFEDNKDNTEALKNCYWGILTYGEEDIDWDTDHLWIRKDCYEDWGFNNVPDFIDVYDEPQWGDPIWEFKDGWAYYVLNKLTEIVGEDQLNDWRGIWLDEL